MPVAELAIDLPPGTWVHDVSTASLDAVVRVLAGIPDGGVGFALVELTGPDLEGTLRRMSAHEGLADVEPLHRTDARVLVHIETVAPLLLRSAQASGVPIEPPVHVTDGVAEVRVRTSNERLSRLASTVAREKTHALGAALLVWVWFVLVHDLLALGVVAAFRLPDAALTAAVLAKPASVFRVLVLSRLGSTGGGGFAAVLAATGLSRGLLAAALVAWCVLPVVAAGALAGRRRL